MQPTAHLLTKQRVLYLAFFAVLLLGLLVAVRLSGQRQDTRNRAAGVGTAIAVSLSPATSSVTPGGYTDYQIILKNISGQNQSILGASVVFTFTPVDSVTITGLGCAPAPQPLSNKAVLQINGNKAELGCYKDTGTPAHILSTVSPNDQIILGTFRATVGSAVSVGSTVTFAFTAADVPVPGTTTNLANAGTGATITVGSGATVTPGNPTLTPILGCNCAADLCASVCAFEKITDPSITYATTFKCAPAFSNADTSWKNSFCQRQMRGKGDADGNGAINLVDYDYYRRAVLIDSGIPPQVNSDHNGDGEVGTTDGMIVLKTLGIMTSTGPVTVSDNFDAATLDATKWDVSTSSNGSSVALGSGVATIIVPQTTSAQWANFHLKKEIKGDFTIEVEFKSVTGSSTNISQFLSFTNWAAAGGELLRIERYGGGILQSYSKSSSTTQTEAPPNHPGITGSVKVKIERVGNIGRTYYDNGNGYVLDKEFTNVYAGNGFVEMATLNFTPDFVRSEAKFDNFTAKVNFVN
jgi:hypothetical protein